MNQVTHDPRKYYLHEFRFFDGDHSITFNIVAINFERRELTVAVSNQGKISHQTFDLMGDDAELYFEYGLYCDKIRVDEFE